MTDLPNIRDLVLHDSDIDLDDVGGSVDPATLSSLAVFTAAPQSGIASGASELVEFGVPTVVGTDLEIDGDDPTLINILTDGIYAVTAFLSINGALTVAQITATIPIPGAAAPYRDYDEGVMGTREFTISASGFLPAGSVITLGGYAETSVSTWTIGSANIVVQRVA